MIVAKFGGSSLSCATQFEKVKGIIKDNSERKVVVVSALGKRNSGDSKITDLLYILCAHLRYHVPYMDIWNMIESRFMEIKTTLGIQYSIEDDLNELKNELSSNISEDYLVSRGEYLTAKLMSNYLEYYFVDSKDAIIFNYDGSINYEITDKKVQEMFSAHQRIVVPGFYGAYPNGAIKLLARGGSDITGSIFAKALNSEMYENWTDVSGILMADPRIITNPKPIREITYTELRELSYMGANVLHEETVFPVQSLNIPINILNTNDPLNPGTIITNHCNDNSQIITGIAGKKDFIAFEITKAHMSNEIGFLRKTLSIFESYDINIEHVPSGIDSISVVVSSSQVEKCLYELISEIKSTLGAEVKVSNDLALIAVVGRNMAEKTGFSGRLFSILGENHINVKMIAQGPQELNIIVGVHSSDYEKSIVVLYQNLVL